MSKITLLILFLPSTLWAESAFDVFSQQVHPILLNRCAECHGTVQSPMHSVADAESAYKVAKRTININFPDNSSLWVRSYNNHCGEVGACGSIDEKLYQGIENWIEKEKDQVIVDGFEKVADGLLPIPELKKDREGKVIRTESLFSVPSTTGESYQFTISRLSESVIYLSQGKIGDVENYTSFEGLEIRSSEIQVRTQNFSEYPVILKPTKNMVDFTSLEGGYLMAILPDMKMTEAYVELFIKGRSDDWTRSEAKELFDKGYALPKEQSVIGPKIRQIHVGHFMNCTIFQTGRVKCWGANYYGQLGMGHEENYGDQEGEMGQGLPYIDLGSGAKVKQLAAGDYTTCALLESNQIKCWGQGNRGQLGNEKSVNIGDSSGEMGDNLVPVDLGTEEEVLKIEGGFYHYCALFKSGKMKCWGYNYYGQLGLEDKLSRGSLTGEMGEDLPFVNLGDGKVKDMSLGSYSTCALFEEGIVKCWGDNYYGQLGLENSLEVGSQANSMGESLRAIDFGKNAGPVKSLSAGSSHFCALFESGKVKCWGAGDRGQLGLGNGNYYGNTSGTMGDNLPYVDLGDEKIKSLHSGSFHNCVFFESGSIKCWGEGYYGQLGNGNRNYIGDEKVEMGENLPEVDLGESKIIDFRSNSYASCALLESEKMKCWGWNGGGELGIGDNLERGNEPNQMGLNLPYVDLGQEWYFE